MRWLHISDIHIGNIPFGANYETFVRKFCDEVNERLDIETNEYQDGGEDFNPMHVVNEGIDCIVYTGDLFDQGKCDQSRISDARLFFNRLYDTCSKKGNWAWDNGEPMSRLFYCPGNHDVLRDAYVQTDDGIVIHRGSELINHRDNGCFSGTENESIYQLYTKCAFKSFDTVMKSIGNFRNETYQSDYPYEYRIYTIPEHALTSFSVIGLNTALVAGQIPPAEMSDAGLRESYNSFLHSHLSHDTKEALEVYKSYHQYMQFKHGQIADDYSHLCFISQSAKNAIRAKLKPERHPDRRCRIPIVFGHHPIEFLSENAQGELFDFMDSINAHIYLCGHMHKALGKEHKKETPWYRVGRIYQITIGGIFMDESLYNQPSFSIGSVVEDDDGNAKLNVSIYTYVTDPFGRQKWIRSVLNETFPIDNPRPRRHAIPPDDPPPYKDMEREYQMDDEVVLSGQVEENEYPDDHKNQPISDEESNNVYKKLLREIKN